MCTKWPLNRRYRCCPHIWTFHLMQLWSLCPVGKAFSLACSTARIITASTITHFDLLTGLGPTDFVYVHISTSWDMLLENSVDVAYKSFGAPSICGDSFYEQDVSVFLPDSGDVFSNTRQGRHRSSLVSATPRIRRFGRTCLVDEKVEACVRQHQSGIAGHPLFHWRDQGVPRDFSCRVPRHFLPVLER